MQKFFIIAVVMSRWLTRKQWKCFVFCRGARPCAPTGGFYRNHGI